MYFKIINLSFFSYLLKSHVYDSYVCIFLFFAHSGMTRKQGSDLAAVFWGMFAWSRGLAVPAAIILPPEAIMCISFVLCIGTYKQIL